MREREMLPECICELLLCCLKLNNSSAEMIHSFLWNQQRSVCECGCEKAREGVVRTNKGIRAFLSS